MGMTTSPVTQAERDEYRRLIELKAWGPRYYELHEKIRSADTAAWRQIDVFGERVGR